MNIVGYCWILSYIVIYCWILLNIVRYCQILSDIVWYLSNTCYQQTIFSPYSESCNLLKPFLTLIEINHELIVLTLSVEIKSVAFFLYSPWKSSSMFTMRLVMMVYVNKNICSILSETPCIMYMVQYATFQDFCLWVGPNRFYSGFSTELSFNLFVKRKDVLESRMARI